MECRKEGKMEGSERRMEGQKEKRKERILRKEKGREGRNNHDNG